MTTLNQLENKDTLESLLASLEQAMKDRERTDEAIAAIRESLDGSLRTSLQQAVIERERNDETIATIRESLSSRIEQMQQAKMTIDAIMGAPVVNTTPAPMGAPVVNSTPAPMEAPVVNSTPVPMKASDTVSLDLGGIGKLIYQYVLVPVIMLALAWLVLSLFNRLQEQKTTASTTSAVRLTASASAAHPQVDFTETELAATQYPHPAPPVDVEEADVPSILTTEIPTDDSTLDPIIDESIIDDDAMSAPVEEEQAVDTSVELVTEVHRDTRERRFPLFSRIQQRNRR